MLSTRCVGDHSKVGCKDQHGEPKGHATPSNKGTVLIDGSGNIREILAWLDILGR